MKSFSGSGGGVGAGNYYGGGSGGYSVTKTASASPELFNDIFNVRSYFLLGAVN